MAGFTGPIAAAFKRAPFGTICFLIGAGLIGLTVWKTTDRLSSPPAPTSCDTTSVPQNAAFVVCDKLLETNRPISIVIDRARVFAKHLDEREGLTNKIEAAKKEIKELAEKQDQTSITRREAKQNELRQDQVKLANLATHGELVLFVEGTRLTHEPRRIEIPKSIEGRDGRYEPITVMLHARGIPKAPGQGNSAEKPTGLWKQVFADRIEGGIAKSRIGLSIVATPAEPDPKANPAAAAGPEFLAASPTDFMVYELNWTLVGGAGFLLSLIGFTLIVRHGSMLRERPRDPGNPNDNPPFSLARVQFLVWSVCILASFFFLFIITGEYAGVLTGSALGLIGISIGTTTIAQGVEQIFPAASIKADAQSQGFLADIVSGTTGASLVRVQYVIWTLLFVGVFVLDVIFRLAMPSFDNNILMLLGLSSAGYVTTKAGGK